MRKLVETIPCGCPVYYRRTNFAIGCFSIKVYKPTIMKKLILPLLILCLLPIHSTSATPKTYHSLWQDLMQQFNRNTSQKSAPRKTYSPSTRTYQPSSYQRTLRRNTISRNRTKKSGSYFQRKSYSEQSRYQDYLWVNATPITRSADIQIVDETPIQLFEIGFSRPRQSNSLSFHEVYYVNKLSFDILDNAGLVSDFSKFQLGIDGKKFNFEADGTITVSLRNARIPAGDDLSIEVSINVEDTNVIPHDPGYVRVRLKDVDAYSENTYKKVRTITKGDRISELVKWDPVPQTTGHSTIGGQVRRIEGRTLHAGESEFVLSMRFEAHYDDMMIQNLTVTDTLSGSSIDSWSYRLSAFDLTNGEVLGESRFLGGKAKFTFRPNLKIGRNQARKIGFKIYLNDRIRLSAQHPEFKLDIYPSNVVVYGIGSGREVPTTNMYFSSQSESFVVANSGVRVESSAVQPDYLITNSSLNTIYRFRVRNTGNADVSIARISTNIWANGMEYPGGISDDDFKLVLINNGQISSRNEFISTVKGDSKIAFDAISEINIPNGYEQEFGIQIALSDNDGRRDNNSVSINLLSDSSLTKGSLANLRSTEKNFIWSDHTDTLHSASSSDFLSGYKVSGLPTNTYVNNDR